MRQYISCFFVCGLSIVHVFSHLYGQSSASQTIDLAYQASWDQEYDRAVNLFDHILQLHPENIDAQLGRAWTLAWDQKFIEAQKGFAHVLEARPDHFEARKGLAYVALWEGNHIQAINRFRRLLTEKPEEKDLIMAIGLARVNAGFLKAARTSYHQLVSLLAPEASELRAAIHHAPAWIEVESWGGLSTIAKNQKWGLRAMRIALNPHSSWSVWARYDNSLSLDGSSTLQVSSPIPALFAGGIVRPNQQLSTRVEVGMRDLPQSELGWILLGEQAVWVQEGIAIKLGGLYDVGDASRVAEHLLYGGLAARIGKRFWIEPMYFHTLKAGRAAEQRFSFSGKYNWRKGYELQIGGILGQQQTEVNVEKNPVSGFWARYQHPIAGRHWLFLMYRQERSQHIQLQVAALGLRIRIEN